MPRSFSIKLNKAFLGKYSCRESAGVQIHSALCDSNSVTAFRKLSTPATIEVSMMCDPQYFADLQKLLTEALLSSFELSLVKSDSSWWDTENMKLSLSGTACDVYWDMWWSILIMRLVAEDGPSETVYDLINESSQSEDNWYNEDQDAEYAMSAWGKRGNTLIRNAAFVYGVGPVSGSALEYEYNILAAKMQL